MLYVLATGNAGKVVELNQGLADLNIEVKSQKAFDCISPEETGLSFVENALIKARSISEQTGKPAIADDSGLAIEALNGEPGIYSSRFAGLECNHEKNIQKVLSMMEGKQNRAAFFYCALVMVRHHLDPIPIIAEGMWCGEIAGSPRGNKGFGYDPIFYIPEKQCTAAELDNTEKNKISHRAKALEVFKKAMKAVILNEK